MGTKSSLNIVFYNKELYSIYIVEWIENIFNNYIHQMADKLGLHSVVSYR